MRALLYNLLWHFALPFIPLRLWWRGRKEPLYRRDWSQRFGLAYPARAGARPLIWLHAVSLGETRAVQPLVHALRERYAHHDFLVTHMTATGRAAAERLFGDFAEICFLPYDFPWAADRFLRHYRPALGIVMETEIWPNLLLRAEALGVPTALVNARLSEKSARGYTWLSDFARKTFSSLDMVAAQSTADASRLGNLGAANLHVTGNLKFDVPSGVIEPIPPFREWFAGRRVFFLASTREGEEKLVFDALINRSLPGDVLVVVVPRHPQRFDEVARLIQSRCPGFSRRSEGPPKADDRIYLGDSMGEMPAYYAACDVAFIGGSLLDYGAQNLIEACAQGAPVILGPSTFNFAQAAELAIAAGAAVQIKDADELLRTARLLLEDPARRAAMKEAGLVFCAAHRGATARTMALIEKLLPSNSPRATD